MTITLGKPNSPHDDHNWLPLEGQDVIIQCFFGTEKVGINAKFQGQFSLAKSKRRKGPLIISARMAQKTTTQNRQVWNAAIGRKKRHFNRANFD